MEKSGPVAIIGAGISGLSCAQALQTAGVEVVIFEATPRISGRCATRLWQGHLIDYGTQYFTAQTPDFKRELLNRLRQFRPIIPPILDPDGRIVVSRGGPRFYVLQGNNYFAQVLSHGLDIRMSKPVEKVLFQDDGVEIFGKIYSAVISSLPAPETARLFDLAESPVEYSSCIAALLEYSGLDVGDSSQCYARLLPDDANPLVASYCENHKAGRIIGDKTVFVVLGGSDFSVASADKPQEEFMPQLLRANDELWNIPAGKCTAMFSHHWRLSRARPDSRREVSLPPFAFLCGDSRVESTIEDVWLDGQRMAEEVLDFLAVKKSAA